MVCNAPSVPALIPLLPRSFELRLVKLLKLHYVVELMVESLAPQSSQLITLSLKDNSSHAQPR